MFVTDIQLFNMVADSLYHISELIFIGYPTSADVLPQLYNKFSRQCLSCLENELDNCGKTSARVG